MQDVKQKIDELSLRLEKLIEVIRLPEKRKKLRNLKLKLPSPTLWNDQQNARVVTQELSDLKKEVEELKDLSETIEI